MDFKEHKWFIRIILRNLRLGLSTEKILAAYHPSAAALFTHASNLEEVCRKCAVPGYVHDGTELAVFTPVSGNRLNAAAFPFDRSVSDASNGATNIHTCVHPCSP